MKTDVPFLEKVKPGVLVNKDSSALNSYRAKRQAEESKNTETMILKEEINILKSDMNEIKSMLQQLVRGT